MIRTRYSHLLVGMILYSVCVAALSRIGEVRLATTTGPTSTEISIHFVSNASAFQSPIIASVRYGTLRGNFASWKTVNATAVLSRGVRLHNANLTQLQPNTAYYYQVGVNGEWYPSDVFSFVTSPQSPQNTDFTFIAIGDIGTTDTASYVIGNITQQGVNPRVVLCTGDLSYADPGTTPPDIWDTFGTLIEPLAANTLFMTTEGQAEQDDISVYQARYATPTGLPYYSFIWGDVYFIALSSFSPYMPGEPQYAFLTEELDFAWNMRESGTVRWVVVFCFTPFYSSADRHGSDMLWRTALEGLLYTHAVDFVFSSHDHNYERTFPVYDDIQLSSATSTANQSLLNPNTLYFTVGTGGRDLYADQIYPPPNWSAFFNGTHFGWTQIDVNGTTGTMHIRFRALVDGASEPVTLDEVWVRRDSNAPCINNCSNVGTYGVCALGKCMCNSGFTLEDCSAKYGKPIEASIISETAYNYTTTPRTSQLPDANWTLPGFNDSSWQSDNAPFSNLPPQAFPYGTHLTIMQNVYLRKRFSLPDIEDTFKLMRFKVYVAGTPATDVYINGAYYSDPYYHDWNYFTFYIELTPDQFAGLLNAGDYNTVAVWVDPAAPDSGYDTLYFDLEIRIVYQCKQGRYSPDCLPCPLAGSPECVHGQCIEGFGGERCKCDPGYTGPFCDQALSTTSTITSTLTTTTSGSSTGTSSTTSESTTGTSSTTSESTTGTTTTTGEGSESTSTAAATTEPNARHDSGDESTPMLQRKSVLAGIIVGSCIGGAGIIGAGVFAGYKLYRRKKPVAEKFRQFDDVPQVRVEPGPVTDVKV